MISYTTLGASQTGRWHGSGSYRGGSSRLCGCRGGQRALASDCANARTLNPSLGNTFDCFPQGGNAFADLIPIGDALMRLAAIALGPMIGMLAIALVLQWIVSGFRKPT